MDKAYIILAHKNMKQLNRLLEKLNDDCSYFFIHIDLKLPDSELSELNWLPGKMQMIKRLDTKWAGLTLVKATLNAMEAVKATKKEFHTITLLSGQDYPIKTNNYINNFFKNSEHRILIEYYELPNYEKWSPRGGLYRVDKFFFGLKSHELFSSRALNFLGNVFPAFKRKQPKNLRPYAGSQWWTIDMYALNYILEFVKLHPAYVTFHEATFAPDELFFHTILLNSKDERIQKSIVNNNKRFIRWKHVGMSHPELLQKEDLHDIMNSDSLFARKFDLEEYPEIFDMIDERCPNKKIVVA